MAKEFDFKAPVELTIKAIERKVVEVDGREEEVRVIMDDAGSKTGPFAADPAYLIDNIEIPLYKSNIVKEVEPGDSIIISAKSSNEVAYYMSLADKLHVEVTAGSTDSDSESEEPVNPDAP